MAKKAKNTAEICVICSSGGHLTEALLAMQTVTRPFYVVTAKQSYIANRLGPIPYHFIVNPHTSLIAYLINFLQSTYLFLKKRPKVIVTTGAGIAVPMCLIAKLFRRKIIFIESAARVTTYSKTGKLLYKYADTFIVQWEPLQKLLPNAINGGVML